MKAEVLTIWRGGAVLGEGPVWSPADKALYFLDIKARFVHRVHLETLASTSWSSPYMIGCIAPRAAGQWICAHQKGLAFLDLRLRGKVALTPIAAPENHLSSDRFNDGKCDPQGRFWAGTMDDAEKAETGAFYRLDAAGRLAQIDAGYGVTNGPTFSLDGRTILTNDSAKRVTYAFDLRDDSMPTNKRIWREHPEADGYPDGMTTDAEGCYWIAFWGAAKIIRFSPDGRPLKTIEIPALNVTSCAFGGPGLDRLFVTSASVGLTQQDKSAFPGSGNVFVVDPGVKGVAAHPFAG